MIAHDRTPLEFTKAASVGRLYLLPYHHVETLRGNDLFFFTPLTSSLHCSQLVCPGRFLNRLQVFE